MKEYEQLILCQLILDKNILYKADFNREHFTTSENRRIFDAIEKCVCVEEIEPNIINICAQNENIEFVEVSHITDLIASAANWEYYFDKIKEAHEKRLIMSLLTVTKNRLMEEGLKVIDDLESGIIALYKNNNEGTTHIGKGMIDHIDEIKERGKSGGELVGLETPWRRLSNMTLGLQPNLFYLLCGRPSQGKTAAAINMMTHLAFQGVSVGFISAESSRKEIRYRIMSSCGGINLTKLKAGMIGNNDKKALLDVTEKLRESKLYINDESGIALSNLLAEAKRMSLTKKIEVLFIDYLQLITVDMKGATDTQKLDEVAKACKKLAKSLRIPVVGLAQLHRNADGKRPELKNIKGSSMFEQAADVVIFLYKDKDDNDFLIIEKCRDGETGLIPVHFNKPLVRFEDRKEV